MRLFLAIKPDRPAEAQIARQLLQVQEAIGAKASALRWTPAENVHITLHFLGELPTGPAASVRSQIGAELAEAPFEVTLGAVGSFPAAGAARVLWLDIVTGRDALARVHAELGRRLAQVGLALEARALSPHVTIARVPDRERARVGDLSAAIGTVPRAPIAWTADRVVLFRSDLSGPVPRYEALQTITLTPPSS